MVDFTTLDPLIKNYATPIVGAALLLSGVFLRLLGKGIAYLILGLGIIGTIYVVLRQPASAPNTWLPIALLAAGVAASAALALALRAISAAIAFGFFTVGWFLLLQAFPSFLSSFPVISSVAGASTWMGFSILTTGGAEVLARRVRILRRPPAVPASAAAAALRFVRR
jgi:hypothetical protein